MNTAIKNRVSKRNFTKEKLSTEEIQKIINLITQINQKSNLTVELLEDGTSAFSNLSKSYGIFHNVRSMLLMKGDKNDIHLKEKVGYYGEELILELVNLGLGTCWVGGTYEKEKLAIGENEELVCVIVIGKIDTSIKDAIIRKVMSTNRKDSKERIITDVLLPDWIEKGLEAVKLAPSARNTQKAMFTYKNNILTASIVDDYVFDMVDLGIAKKHFELESNGKFEIGNGGKFIPN